MKQTQKKQAKQKSNVTINYLSGHNDYHDDQGDDDDHDKPTNKSKNCQRFNYIMVTDFSLLFFVVKSEKNDAFVVVVNTQRRLFHFPTMTRVFDFSDF